MSPAPTSLSSAVFLDGIRSERADATPLQVPSLTTSQANLMFGAATTVPQN